MAEESKSSFSPSKLGCSGCGCFILICMLVATFVCGATHGRKVIPEFIQKFLGISEKARTGINDSIDKLNQKAEEVKETLEQEE